MAHHYDDIAEMEARHQPNRHLVSFSVDCLPIPQPRQRHRVVKGAKPYVLNYTDKKHPVQGFKAALIFESRQAWEEPPYDGPVEIRLRFRFPLPASARIRERSIVNQGRTLPYVAKKRNDGDNLEKAVWDALTGVVYLDDGQICRWSGERVYAKEPGVDIWIAEWQP